jgi:tetratricopeptide (TPR) repeat protein
MRVIFFIFLLIVQSCYSQSLDSFKKKSLAFENLGWELYQKHEFEKSFRNFDSSISFDSTRYISYQLKAESLWFIQRYGEAADIYTMWMERDRDTNILRIGAEVMNGMLYDKAGMRKKAKEHYRHAIDLYENDYKPLRQFVEVEEIEYVFAFGLLRNKKLWKNKLKWFENKYHTNYHNLEAKSRKELLNFHFDPFEFHESH